MGCISSKVITKSISFHRELSQSLQRTTDSIPVPDEVFPTTTGNGSHQFLAFTSTAKTISNSLLTRSSNTCHENTDLKRALDPSSTETINTWELIAGVQEQHRMVKQEGQQHADPSLLSIEEVEKLDIYKAKRSISCQWLPENETKLGSISIIRSRSFHTVEEYDAMVENIQLTHKQAKGFDHEHDSEATNIISNKSHDLADYKSSSIILEATQSSPSDEESISSSSKPKEVLPSLNNSTSIEKPQPFGDKRNLSGKGSKRKATVNGLKSLEIPSTVEFPSVASLREWLQVNSPGAYATPTFGSYNLQTSTRSVGKECSESEDSIFDPDLVAAFEQCMHQMEMEETMILEQIEQILEEDSTKDVNVEAKEERSSNIFT